MLNTLTAEVFAALVSAMALDAKKGVVAAARLMLVGRMSVEMAAQAWNVTDKPAVQALAERISQADTNLRVAYGLPTPSAGAQFGYNETSLVLNALEDAYPQSLIVKEIVRSVGHLDVTEKVAHNILETLLRDGEVRVVGRAFQALVAPGYTFTTTRNKMTIQVVAGERINASEWNTYDLESGELFVANVQALEPAYAHGAELHHDKFRGLTPNEKRVLRLLESDFPKALSPTDIGQEIGKERSKNLGSSFASPICKHLVDLGFAKRTEKGHYAAIVGATSQRKLRLTNQSLEVFGRTPTGHWYAEHPKSTRCFPVAEMEFLKEQE
ncbi:hypothetical protein HNP46_000349 [Pseudomonas nitritireducens]|uniref:Uncharacterized protein n=1 Tax=Pseudomonas nitroreducens TaxID=46680 RepID=A0A7W7KFW6_PSENT|nr:hypothetical protein [Pseudomonas nitritireducens]MBB4861538.1 hypothetical protein [Pseudomonas nitritireducens]